MKISASILLLTLGLLSNAIGQSVSIGDIRPRDLEIKAFTLSTDQSVKIDGSGGVFRDDYKILIYYAWILDSDTREVVWHLFDELKGYRDFREKNGFFDFSVDVPLKAGNYELYFTGAYDNRGWSGEWTINSFDDLLDEIFDSRDKQKFQYGMQEDLFVKVAASGLKEVDVDDLFQKQVQKSKIYFARAEDHEHFEQGFTLTGEAKMRVYAIGEGRKDETFDYAWIIDAATRERVFEMNYRNTDFAGGADKNLKVDEVITLPKGSYLVSYSTDDTHSYERWNSLPPDDPQFWGITVTPESSADAKKFTEYDPPKIVTPIAEITRVRNNELESVGFTLKRDMDVRILCIGEGDDDEEEMADYGWIVDANTRKTVWKMKGYRTKHAGGASKNRRAEDVIDLPKGDYIAYYSTDGSHAYGSWNSSRPAEAESYGITIWATDESDLNNVSSFDPRDYRSKDVIAEITMVGDDEYEKESFILDKETRVTVIAMGEGQDYKMFDYGWIRNMDTGKIIWEMEYGDTDHAGGARKNRIAVENLTLPAGEYRIYYETDGSHSYRDWNSEPPHDPQGYGIRVLKAE